MFTTKMLSNGWIKIKKITTKSYNTVADLGELYNLLLDDEDCKLLLQSPRFRKCILNKIKENEKFGNCFFFDLSRKVIHAIKSLEKQYIKTVHDLWQKQISYMTLPPQEVLNDILEISILTFEGL